MKKNVFFSLNKKYFTIPNNPFPFLVAMQVFNLLLSVVSWSHFSKNFYFTLFKFFLLFYCMLLWWSNLSEKYLGGIYHSLIESFFRFGFVLFMVSEVMFFFGFFWSFFHSCWAPTFYMGMMWPPFEFLEMIDDAFSYCNTILLLSSAATITVSHKMLLSEKFFFANYYLMFTCILGFMFLFLQSHEYMASSISINSTIFATTFFLLTGFHGLHVTVGLIFLMITFFRFCASSFSSTFHQGLSFAIWYWHFVDVVWLGLYGCLYHYSHMLYNSYLAP